MNHDLPRRVGAKRELAENVLIYSLVTVMVILSFPFMTYLA